MNALATTLPAKPGASPGLSLNFSLALADGDFAFAGNEAGLRDLALVAQNGNFAQALQVIIATPFGSDEVNVNYGLDVAAIFTLANTVRSVQDVIRLNLIKSLSFDDRVAQIGDIVFDDDPAFSQLAPDLAIELGAALASGDPGQLARRSRQWHAVLSMTTIVGGQQSVAVSGATP